MGKLKLFVPEEPRRMLGRSHVMFGFPPNPHWRFRTGDWPEYVIVYSCMLLVFLGVWQAIIKI